LNPGALAHRKQNHDFFYTRVTGVKYRCEWKVTGYAVQVFMTHFDQLWLNYTPEGEDMRHMGITQVLPGADQSCGA
jgi:hypothetical protein